MKRRTFLALTASLAIPNAMSCAATETAQYDELAGVKISPDAVRLVEDMDAKALDLSKPHLCWTLPDVAAVWGVPRKPFRRWIGRYDRPDDTYRGVCVNDKLWFLAIPIAPQSFQDALDARFGVTLQRSEESSINRRFRTHVKRQMAERGLGLHDLSRQTQVSPRFLADVLDGHIDAAVDFLGIVADAFKVEPSELLNDFLSSRT